VVCTIEAMDAQQRYVIWIHGSKESREAVY